MDIVESEAGSSVCSSLGATSTYQQLVTPDSTVQQIPQGESHWSQCTTAVKTAEREELIELTGDDSKNSILGFENSYLLCLGKSNMIAVTLINFND